MLKEELRFQILQTLIRGRLVVIEDSKEKAHYLGRGFCDNLNIINNYIEQLDYDNIVTMVQEDEYSDLHIVTKNKLKFLWEVE